MGFVKIVLMCLVLSSAVDSGPLTALGAYGTCQTGCNAVYVACCAGAGTVAGTFTLGLGAPVALVACSAALGTCMTACAAITITAAAAPIP